MKDFYESSYKPFVIPEFETVLNTTIQNRAPVTRSMKAIAGIEYIHIMGIKPISNEFGPNGEAVFTSDNNSRNIRFVGDWTTTSGTTGTSPITTTIGHYIEHTFWGTGINLLTRASGSFDFRASLDGGAEGANIFTTGYSAVLDARNYAPKARVTLYSGLSLGWHTVKIRNATAASQFHCFGFEILNERTDLAVYQGSGMARGKTYITDSMLTSAFNIGISGIKGARVVKYIKDGLLQTAVTEVAATAKYLANTDHTNEEAFRKINFREFGANRADDFSTLGASTTERAYTLDDESTTLVGGSVWADVNGMIMGNIINGFTTLTFTGSGLDIITLTNGSPGDTIAVYVDGVYVGDLPPAVTLTKPLLVKVCSGLPYGSHSVKFRNTSDLSDRYVQDFIIYQPEKPAHDGFEVMDFNVLADFVPNTSAGTFATGITASTGILRKMNVRGMTYVGTFTLGAINNNFPSGYAEASTQANGNYIEYTFWGKGYDHRFFEQTARAALVNVTLNGLPLTTANFPTALTANTGNGVSMNLATGVLDMQATSSIGFGGVSVYNLPLAKYTLRFTKGDALATVLEASCIDIITPIHINDVTLKKGSMSLASQTRYAPEPTSTIDNVDLSKAKAWLLWDGVNNKILSSHNISSVIAQGTGDYRVYFEKPFKNDNYTGLGSAMSGTGKNVHLGPTIRKPSVCQMYTLSSAGGLEALQAAMNFYGELIDEGNE